MDVSMKLKLRLVFAYMLLLPGLLVPSDYNSLIIKLPEYTDYKALNKIQSEGLVIKDVFDFPPDKKLQNSKAQKSKFPAKTIEREPVREELEKYMIVIIPQGMATEVAVDILKKTIKLEFIEPNYVYKLDISTKPNDPKYGAQWALKALNAEKAWEKASGKGILVGVIDTGIDFLHPDLAGQLWINNKEDINGNGKFDAWSSGEKHDGITGDLNGIDEDRNGITDDVIGYDFVDQSVTNLGDYALPDPVPDDEHSHGTLVSGVIAANRNNKIGIAGLAYDSKVITARAFDVFGNGETDDIARAIVYCADNGAKVINLSFGEATPSSIMHDAIKYASSLGCVIFASSGNNGWNIPHYPSDYDEVISVGGTDINNKRYFRSNYGSNLAFMAPGVDILSTTLNGDYKSVNGTSFSAPYAAAAAALLLENDNTLTKENISGILKGSALDINKKGWDDLTGAGIIDAGKALGLKGKTAVYISYPGQWAVFNKSKTPLLNIWGSVATPLLDSFMVLIMPGENPEDIYTSNDWDTLKGPQGRNYTDTLLAQSDISKLQDTVYTLRLLVKLKNKSTIEDRVTIEVFSDKSKISFINLKKGDVWHGDRRVFLVTATTSRKSNFYVEYRKKGTSGPFKRASEFYYFDNFHYLELGNEAPADTDLEARAVAYREGFDTAFYNFEFRKSSESMPVDGFAMKQYSLPSSIYVNELSDLFGDGKLSLIANHKYFGNWYSTTAYSFDDSKFTKRDSTTDIYIPVAYGDSNKDGIPEVFTKVSGQSYLFQHSPSKNLFGNLLYSNTSSRNFWAQDLYDIDGDGADELIASSDTAVHIVKFRNGKYENFASLIPDKSNRDLGTNPGVVCGDFDGDGKGEILIATESGNLLMYEFNGNEFEGTWKTSDNIASGNQYMCKLDIDGDGKPEFIQGSFGSAILYDYVNAGKVIWTFRLYKSDKDNNYKVVWEDQFSGVQVVQPTENGVAGGDIDNIPGDEFIISKFPDYYVFKWDKDSDKAVPFWWYPQANTSNTIIKDFDGNGRKELAFTTWQATRFFEFYGPRIAAPAGFDGWALNDNQVYLFWNKTGVPDKYEIIRVFDDNTGESVAVTSESSVVIGNLLPDTDYRFIVRALNSQDTSEVTYPVHAFTHKQVYPVLAKDNGQRTVITSFSGKLPANNIEPGMFTMISADGLRSLKPVNAITGNDTTVLLHFQESLPPGSYKLAVGSFPDFYRTPTLVDSVALEIKVPEQSPMELYLAAISVSGNGQLLLTYSEEVEAESSENPGNYDLSPFGKVSKVIRNSDKSQVSIFLDPAYKLEALGRNYMLTVTNVEAASGRKMTTGAGSTIGFVFSKESSSGAFIYPNPVRLSDKPEIFFANLSVNADVYIMTLDGKMLRRLTETDGNGGVEWDGRDDSGKELDSGIYLFKVKTKSPDGTELESDLKKFAIIR